MLLNKLFDVDHASSEFTQSQLGLILIERMVRIAQLNILSLFNK